MTQQTPQNLKFEDALKRLEELATQMESGKLGLEDMVKAFEEGQTLIKACSSKLADVERRIDILVKNPDGTLAETPLPPQETP